MSNLSELEKGDTVRVDTSRSGMYSQFDVTTHRGPDREINAVLEHSGLYPPSPRTGDDLPPAENVVRHIHGTGWCGHELYITDNGDVYYVSEDGGHDPYYVEKNPNVEVLE